MDIRASFPGRRLLPVAGGGRGGDGGRNLQNTNRLGRHNLPLQNPVRVAEDAAVVDNISNGRFDLGVVLGYRKEEYDGMGVPMIERPSRMEEGLEVLGKALSGEKFSYEGKRFKYENTTVTPKPVQKPVPLYVGAFEEPAIRRAGRFGLPLLIGPGRTVSMVRDTLGYYNDEAKKAGKDPDAVEHILLRETFVSPDRNKAIEGGTKYIIDHVQVLLHPQG